MAIVQLLLDCIFPKFCCHCGWIGSFLCEPCYQEIVFYPLPLTTLPQATPLDTVLPLAEYDGVMKSLITSLKYQGVKEVGPLLGRLLYYTSTIPAVDCLTAVPLHRDRLRQRGYNQAELIAQELARLCGLPYQPLLIRNQATGAQAKLSKKDRLKNLQSIFAPNPVWHGPPPGTVVLIDDVVTTGATLSECARVLKTMGVQQVIGLTLAHGH